MDGEAPRDRRADALAYLSRRGIVPSPHGEACAEFAEVLYHGLKRFPNEDRGLRKVAWHDPDHLSWNHDRELATYDGSEMTLMVLMAHDLGLRVTVNPVNFRYVEIALGRANGLKPFGVFHAHPTLDETIAWWRETHAPRRLP